MNYLLGRGSFYWISAIFLRKSFFVFFLKFQFKIIYKDYKKYYSMDGNIFNFT